VHANNFRLRLPRKPALPKSVTVYSWQFGQYELLPRNRFPVCFNFRGFMMCYTLNYYVHQRVSRQLNNILNLFLVCNPHIQRHDVLERHWLIPLDLKLHSNLSNQIQNPKPSDLEARYETCP
jgi:hypothetical protein